MNLFRSPKHELVVVAEKKISRIGQAGVAASQVVTDSAAFRQSPSDTALNTADSTNQQSPPISRATVSKYSNPELSGIIFS